MRGLLVALWCAGLLAGCAAPGTGGGPPDAVRLTGLPFHPQRGFVCGPAALSTMLAGAGAPVAPADLEGRFYGADGDPRPLMIDIAHTYGRFAYPIQGVEAMQAELVAGHAVLVVENLGVAIKPLWNCAVAVGYRDGGRHVLLNDDGDEARPTARRVLQRLWAETDEWGMVILRPGELPATAAEDRMVAAARGLQRTGHLKEAVLAYDTTLTRWPRSAPALMGLGDSLYLLGDVKAAVSAFRSAAAVANDPAPAQAALDRALAELGRISGGAAGPARHLHDISAIVYP